MKTVVITGAGKGIGLADTKKFLEEGWKVIGTYLDAPIPLQHENLVNIQYDQSDPRSIEKVAEEIKKVTPTIDVLINNAGVLLDGDSDVIDPVKVRKTLEINVIGVADITERLLPLMKEGSHIINMGSGCGAFYLPVDDKTSVGYRLSKAALNMFTKYLAFRLEDKGITVSSIAPGWVKTDMGLSIATAKEGPDREPEEAADDIYKLATSDVESGKFWRYGVRTEW